MSLLRRVSRALETLSRPQLDERMLFGVQGEDYASKVLEEQAILSRVTNPIIPPSHGRTRALESDFLVYTQGALFCIEIKHYKGKISYASGAPNAQHPPALLQEKTGKYGERFAPITHPNPLKKTRTFIWHLKKYLRACKKTTLFKLPDVVSPTFWKCLSQQYPVLVQARH